MVQGGEKAVDGSKRESQTLAFTGFAGCFEVTEASAP